MAGLAGRSAHAATFVFDPGLSAVGGTDGSGTWDAGITSDFFNTSGGTNPQPWSNSTGDTAVFGVGGTAGTVTVAGTVNVGTIDFNQVSGSYLLTGGTINLGSASPVVSGTITTVAGVTPTVASTINGVNAVFNAPGTLTLTGANTFANATGSNIAASVATGTVVMGGGVTETFNGELAVGSATSPSGGAGSPNVATLTINSGTTASANNNVGLGNIDNNGSTTAYQSLFMNVNGTLKTTGLFFTEYQTAQNTSATVNINGGGTVTAGTFGFGQSAGTTTAVNVASGGSLTTTSVAGDYLGEAAGTNVTLTNNGTVTANYTIYTNQNGGTSTGVATIVNNGTLTVLNGYNLRFGGNTTLTNTGTVSANLLAFGNVGGTYAEALNVTAGTVTLAARSDLNSDAGGTGSVNVNITGGTFTDPLYPYLTNGAGQTTTVTQTGGVFNNPSTSTTDGVFFNNGLATYNLAGGMLKANNVGTSGAPTVGSTFIFNGGTLQAQINSTLGAGFFSPPTASIGAGGGTIDTQAFNVSAATALTTGVTGGTDGGFTKLGVGTLSMTAANTYTGPTTVGVGTLALTGTGSINGSSGIAVNGAGARLLQLSSVAGATPVMLTSGSVDGVGTIGAVTVGAGTGGTVTNGNGSTGTLTMNALRFLGVATDSVLLQGGSFNTSPGQVVVNALTTPSTAGQVTVNVSAPTLLNGTYDLIQYGTLTGSGLSAFTLGTVTGLGGKQTATLGLLGNDLVLNINGAIDQWTGAVSNVWQAGGPTNFRLTTTGAAIAFTNGDAVLFDDTANASSTGINLGTAVTPASMTFNNSSLSYTISSTGGFGINGSGGLIKSGTAPLTINTSNSYTGGTTLNAGRLNLGNANAVGTGPLTITGGTLDNTSGAVLQLPGNNVAVSGSFAFAGSSQLNTGAGTITLTGSPTITVGGAGLYVNGPITQSAGATASLTLAGGTTTLAGASTFTGGTNVASGTVNLQQGGQNGTLVGPLTIASGATVNANVVDAIGYGLGTSVTTLTVNSGATFADTIQPGGNGNEGYVTNVVLAGGSVTTLNFNNGVPVGNFTFNEGTANTSYGITTVAGSPMSTISTAVEIRGTGTLPIAANANLTMSGPITQDATGSVLKTGAGTLTLGDLASDGLGDGVGSNTYSGGTTIAQGAIRFNEVNTFQGAIPNTFLGTGTTVIQSNGTLGGNGFTGGPVVVAGGTITAGQDAATIGVLTTTTQTWNSSGSYLVKLSGSSTSDKLIMSGLTIAAASGSPFAVLPSFSGTLSNGSTYVIATDTNAAGTANPFNAAIGSTLVLSSAAARPATGLAFALASQPDGGGYDLLLEVVAAPEPTSLVFLGVAGLPLALGRRRRLAGRPTGASPVVGGH